MNYTKWSSIFVTRVLSKYLGRIYWIEIHVCWSYKNRKNVWHKFHNGKEKTRALIIWKFIGWLLFAATILSWRFFVFLLLAKIIITPQLYRFSSPVRKNQNSITPYITPDRVSSTNDIRIKPINPITGNKKLPLIPIEHRNPTSQRGGWIILCRTLRFVVRYFATLYGQGCKRYIYAHVARWISKERTKPTIIYSAAVNFAADSLPTLVSSRAKSAKQTRIQGVCSPGASIRFLLFSLSLSPSSPRDFFLSLFPFRFPFTYASLSPYLRVLPRPLHAHVHGVSSFSPPTLFSSAHKDFIRRFSMQMFD